ncbi:MULTISPECIES: SH3 domain-containing protein [unclassified Streptomyces]|uniref:SH3 domain-containing protein n=1 Tax=unclassified Streptomyces TaxID=2593676 RepID=UPI00081F0CAD|nr:MULTISPECIES: SH3 domain-containing protein [unclassified Streptomyces]MYR95647.1 SH3 domain-containing protein [Streptomyces sp. SID4937]SCD94216.1 SH3 domain-containing protein [Streptomyces sp. ScaeMP-e83]
MSPLSRPSRFRRIGLCVATGALAAVTAAAPAMAADPHPVDHRDQAAASAPASDELSASALQREHEARQEAQAQNQANPQAPKRTYKGRVIAKPNLLLRDRPTRSSRVVGSVKYGTVVNIFCKTTGDNVDGNNRWYLLTDGTWAWGSARYIENIGAAPHFC